MYYKDHLSLVKRDNLCTLKECLVREVKSRGKIYFFICLYRSPRQNQDQFELFCNHLDLCLTNINDINCIFSVPISDVKGCVCYIFASLFCKSKIEHFWNKERCFLFHFKSSFILEIIKF